MKYVLPETTMTMLHCNSVPSEICRMICGVVNVCGTLRIASRYCMNGHIFECRALLFSVPSFAKSTLENFMMAFLSVFKSFTCMAASISLSPSLSLSVCMLFRFVPRLGYALIGRIDCLVANLQYHFRVPCYFDNASCIHNQIRSDTNSGKQQVLHAQIACRL